VALSWKHLKEILPRITGLSLFGVSWEPKEAEREIIRDLTVFLEDRRVLYDPYDVEVWDHCILSVIDIRRELVHAIQRLDQNADAVPSLRAMQYACRRFLEFDRRGPRWTPYIALGELRRDFRFHIALLCLQHEIDVPEPLVRGLPLTDEEFGDMTVDRFPPLP